MIRFGGNIPPRACNSHLHFRRKGQSSRSHKPAEFSNRRRTSCFISL